jgi:hypothetical protein
MKCVCFHGYFYKPRRGNPWLEIIKIKKPGNRFHSWNDRVAQFLHGTFGIPKNDDQGGNALRIALSQLI